MDELAGAAAELQPTVIALHEARIAAVQVMAVYSVVVDALTRRLVEFALAELGRPAVEFAWLALGSQARREMAPSADVDNAIVWFGEEDSEAVRRQLHAVGREVLKGLERCGLHADLHGACAARTADSSAHWRPGSARRRAGSPTRRRSRP